jgi:hypothetical protein
MKPPAKAISPVKSSQRGGFNAINADASSSVNAGMKARASSAIDMRNAGTNAAAQSGRIMAWTSATLLMV